VAEADSRTGVGELTVLLPSWRFTWRRLTCRPAPSVPVPTTVPFWPRSSAPGHAYRSRQHQAVSTWRRSSRPNWSEPCPRRRDPLPLATAALQVAGRRGRDQRIANGQDASSDYPRAAGTRAIGRPGPRPACCLLGQGLARDRSLVVARQKSRLTPSAIYQMITDPGSDNGLPELHPYQLKARALARRAGQRRFRGRPDAPGRMEDASDAHPLRRERRRRARDARRRLSPGDRF
jgi:hypothetical protein